MQQEVVNLPQHQKLYFASDFHLGAPNHKTSLYRERRIITWLNQIKKDAHSICLLGDIFDFWFEYKHVIPKGHIRIQGKLAELQDEGINIYFFSGNHDMWMFEYFEQEIGAHVHHNPIIIKTNQHSILVGHGDGLGNGENAYKMLKKVYTNKFLRWVFKKIHPDYGVQFAKAWSKKSWERREKNTKVFQRKEHEQLFMYCAQIEEEEHHDFYIFGHRHLPLDLNINTGSKYINTGDWIHFNTYAVYDGNTVELATFKQEDV